MSSQRPHQITSFHLKGQVHPHFYLRPVCPRANGMMGPVHGLRDSAGRVRDFPPFDRTSPDLSFFS